MLCLQAVSSIGDSYCTRSLLSCLLFSANDYHSTHSSTPRIALGQGRGRKTRYLRWKLSTSLSCKSRLCGTSKTRMVVTLFSRRQVKQTGWVHSRTATRLKWAQGVTTSVVRSSKSPHLWDVRDIFIIMYRHRLFHNNALWCFSSTVLFLLAFKISVESTLRSWNKQTRRRRTFVSPCPWVLHAVLFGYSATITHESGWADTPLPETIFSSSHSLLCCVGKTGITCYWNIDQLLPVKTLEYECS